MEPFITWSIDFVSDVLECGHKFLVINIIDDSDRLQLHRKCQCRSLPIGPSRCLIK